MISNDKHSFSETPYGQMPVLTVDKTMINQSGAICRYLAREFSTYHALSENGEQ